MRGLTHLMWVQFKLYLREPAAFFFTLAFPALCLLLFGAIYGNEPMPAFWGRPVGTVDASVPAYLGLIIGTIALMNIPIDTAANRDSGALRRFRATPLRPVTYLAASIAVYFLVALLGIAILVVIGKLVFDLKLAGSWPAVLAGFTLSSLAFFAVGYVLASVARSARMAQALGMALFFPMIFLSGAGMPVQMLPPGLQEFSKLLPLSYVVKLMQCLWFPLAGWSPAYYLVGANFFGLMWAFLPFGGAVAGNVGLMLLMLLRSLVTSGEPLASLWGWPLLIALVVLGWAVLLAGWMRSVMVESQRRQQLIETLEAARQSLAQAEHQAGVLAERQRLAQEIHDTLAQDFTSIVLHLEAADAALPGEAEPVRTHVARAREAAREGLAEARRLVLALRPEPLEGAALPEALRRVAARWAEETGIPAAVTVTGEPVPLHPEAEVTLLRAAQEALANVRKHAQARQVSVTLSYMEDQVALDVQDDGVGFAASAPAEGFGLAAMRQRAEQLGGTAVVESASGHGTTVAVTLPLQPS